MTTDRAEERMQALSEHEVRLCALEVKRLRAEIKQLKRREKNLAAVVVPWIVEHGPVVAAAFTARVQDRRGAPVFDLSSLTVTELSDLVSIPGLVQINSGVLRALPHGEFRAVEQLRAIASPGPGTSALVFD